MKVLRNVFAARLPLAALFLMALLVFATGCAKKEIEEIKFGAILPLTGDAALYGRNAKEGIELALKEINDSGGINGMAVKVLFEDCQANPSMAVSAFNKLATVNNVQAVIGGITSSVTLALAPLANERNVVILSPAATSPDITNAGEYIFRNWPSDDYESKSLFQYAYGVMGIENFSMLYVNNDYGFGIMRVFSEELERVGKKFQITESFEQGSSDFRSQLSKIKDSASEALYIVSYPISTIKILQQIVEIGLDIQLFSTSAFQDEEIIAKAGNAAESVIYPYPTLPDSTSPVAAKFMQSYQEIYGKAPGIVCDTGYDALMMIAAAIHNSGGVTGSDIKDGLHVLSRYQGASGVMTFDENGDIEKPMTINVVKEARFSILHR